MRELPAGGDGPESAEQLTAALHAAEVAARAAKVSGPVQRSPTVAPASITFIVSLCQLTSFDRLH